MVARRCGPWMKMPLTTLIVCFGVFCHGVAQVAWASRPRSQAFVRGKLSPYKATTGGAGYGGHGKAAD